MLTYVLFFFLLFVLVVEWLGINAFTLSAGACLFICGSYFVRTMALIYYFKLDMDISPFLAR